MKKNKFPMVPVIIGVALLLVVGFILKTSGKKSLGSKTGSSQSAQEVISGKIQDLIASGRSIKCTYKKDTENESVIYIKGKNFSTDFVSSGKNGHMIYKDGCSWIWADGEGNGITMCSKDSVDEDPFKDIEKSIPQGVDFKCQPLLGGDNKFVPPSSVKFNDLSGFMKEEQN